MMEAEPSVSPEEEMNRAYAELEAQRQRVFDAIFPEGTGNLVAHAKRELQLAGLFDADSDYGGALGDAVLELIRVFAAQGHSGGSAPQVLLLFSSLAQFKCLTPNDHSLFHDVGEFLGVPPGTHLQDDRDSEWFSEDGGQTWYSLSQREVDREMRARAEEQARGLLGLSVEDRPVEVTLTQQEAVALRNLVEQWGAEHIKELGGSLGVIGGIRRKLNAMYGRIGVK